MTPGYDIILLLYRYWKIVRRWGATRAPYRVCGRQCLGAAFFFLSGSLCCFPETTAINPGVWGSAPAWPSFFRIIYGKRIDAGLQILIVFTGREFQQFPLVTVFVVIIHPIVYLAFDCLKGLELLDCIPYLVFHVTVKAFLRRIVPTVSSAGHGLYELFFF